MKILNQARKYGNQALAVAATGSLLLSTTPALAEADAALITAATAGLTNAGDTSKGVYILVAGAIIVVMAITWGISALRSAKRG